MKKALKIIGIIVAVLFVIGLLLYYKSAGFTKKQKYENCAETCEKMMFHSSNIPLCKMRCEEITGYTPAEEVKKEKKDSEPPEPDDTAEAKGDAEYYCEWSWPQKIIEKASGKVVFPCTYERPWCDPADRSYENVACCSDNDDDKKLKTGCIKLPDLLGE